MMFDSVVSDLLDNHDDLVAMYDNVFGDDTLQPLTTTCEPLTTPKYIGKPLIRGTSVDKFFNKPVNETLVDNLTIINTLNNGSEQDMLVLPNLCCSTPTQAPKCEVALESKVFTEATFILMTEFGVQSLADVYRHLAMLSDRRCVFCPLDKPNINIGCIMGTFLCINCTKKYGNIPVKDGFKLWLQQGSQARHAVRVYSNSEMAAEE